MQTAAMFKGRKINGESGGVHEDARVHGKRSPTKSRLLRKARGLSLPGCLIPDVILRFSGSVEALTDCEFCAASQSLI